VLQSKTHYKKHPVFLTLLILSFASAACQAISKAGGNENEFIPVCTPPACQPGEQYFCEGECPGGCGTTCVLSRTEYNGCAFTVDVPDELSTSDVGWIVVFSPSSSQTVWVSIHARKMPSADLGAAFEQAALSYSA